MGHLYEDDELPDDDDGTGLAATNREAMERSRRRERERMAAPSLAEAEEERSSLPDALPGDRVDREGGLSGTRARWVGLGDEPFVASTREETTAAESGLSPTSRSATINEAEDALGDLDLSAIDDLEENARGAAVPPPNPFDEPETFDRNPGEDVDMRGWQDTPSDPEPETPADPEAAAAFDAWNEAAMAGDPTTLGAAMDPRATTASLDLDEPYPEGTPEAENLLTPLDNPAAAATFAVVNEGLRRAPPVGGGGLFDDAEGPDTSGAMAAEPGLPDRNPGTDDMDMREWQNLPNDDELMSEEEAFAGAAPSPDDETWGYASDEDPVLSFGPDLVTDSPYDGPEPIAKVPSGTSGPPAPDFTGADWSDAIRRGLRGLFGGLGAAGGGHSSVPFRSERAAMEERLRARDTAKGEATRAHETAASRSADRAADREARSADRAADRESREAMDADRAERDRMRIALSERGADTREREADSRILDRSSRITEREEGSDPASDVSARARSRLPAMVAGLPPELAETIRPELESMGENLSADDVAALERMPATAWRAWLTRRRGLGGGSPGGGTGTGRSNSAVLAEALRARGDEISDEEAAAMRPADLSARLRSVLGATGEAEIISGVYGDAALIGSPTSVERRELRGSIIRARRASGALADLASIADEWGVVGTLPETAEADAAASLRMLMAYSTALGETGIISPGEVESIRAELPNPASIRELGLGGFERRLESWRRSVVGSVEDDLEARGVSADSMERALGWIATGSFGGPGASAGGGGTVEMTDGSGAVYDIPAAEVEAARAAGLMEAR